MTRFQDPAADFLLPNLIDVSSVSDVTGILVNVRMNGHVAYILRLKGWRHLCDIPVLSIIHEAVSYGNMWCLPSNPSPFLPACSIFVSSSSD